MTEALSREHGLEVGMCDDFFCSQIAHLKPLFDDDGNIAAHVCVLGCRREREESASASTPRST